MTITRTYAQDLRREATVNGQVKRFARNPSNLLTCLLLHHPDAWVPLQTIYEYVWPGSDGGPEYIDTSAYGLVAHLRQSGIPIETCVSRGYRIPAWARHEHVEWRIAA